MAVTAGAGVIVGVLRRFFRVPVKLAGTVEELKDQRVEPSTVPGAVAVSLVSLAGGASLGPEDALGKMGGGLGTWVSERQKLSEDVRATNTLSGMSAAYGGLLSSPILASILTLEIARPKAARFADTLVGGLLASTVAFAVYFPIAGSTFVGLYALPSYKYEDWQLLAAVPLGLVAGALALITAVAIGVMTKLMAPLAKFTVLRPVIGGIAFGLVGVALPLTLFTGTDQLTTVIHDGAALGAGLLIAVVFAKILVFAVCEATGFIGGPFLVMLFIGGTAGMTAHVLIPGLPEGLAFTAMFAALPAALVAAPFSLILLGALTTQIGTLQIAPVAVAVLTAYLAVSGSGVLMSLARKAGQARACDDVGRFGLRRSVTKRRHSNDIAGDHLRGSPRRPARCSSGSRRPYGFANAGADSMTSSAPDSTPAPGAPPPHRRYTHRIGRLLVVWAINTGALMLLAWVLPGFSIENWAGGLALAALLGLLNALVWPLLVRIALPLAVITLGLGVLVLNGVFVWLASDALSDYVSIDGLWTGIVVAIGVTLVNNVVTLFLGIDDEDLYYRQVIRRQARAQGVRGSAERRSGCALPGDRRARPRRARAGDAGRQRADDGPLASQRFAQDRRVGVRLVVADGGDAVGDPAGLELGHARLPLVGEGPAGRLRLEQPEERRRDRAAPHERQGPACTRTERAERTSSPATHRTR